MAGAGWRTFSDGAVLTAAQVQSYLQDQAVQVYASSGARSTALGTAVSNGMVSFVTDSQALEVYKSGAWTGVILTGGTASDSAKLSGRTLSVGTATPSSPAVGDLWIQV